MQTCKTQTQTCRKPCKIFRRDWKSSDFLQGVHHLTLRRPHQQDNQKTGFNSWRERNGDGGSGAINTVGFMTIVLRWGRRVGNVLNPQILGETGSVQLEIKWFSINSILSEIMVIISNTISTIVIIIMIIVAKMCRLLARICEAIPNLRLRWKRYLAAANSLTMIRTMMQVAVTEMQVAVTELTGN